MINEIVLTGASGLLGTHIRNSNSDQSVTFRPLSRKEEGWDPGNGICTPSLLENSQAVIHLAGAPIADKRWSDTRKQELYDSRVNGTRALATAMAEMSNGPRTLICASASGIYGDGGDKVLDESSPAGNGFLPHIVEEWEKAADPAREAGIRVVHLRLGIVLARDGGALQKMLPVFKLGLAGKLGKGTQWMSWIHVQDAADLFLKALHDPKMAGIYNLVSPNPVTNAEYTKILGSALHRPTFIPAPAFAIKAALGEMGETLLLEGARVVPTRLLNAGYAFKHPTLEESLADLVS